MMTWNCDRMRLISGRNQATNSFLINSILVQRMTADVQVELLPACAMHVHGEVVAKTDAGRKQKSSPNKVLKYSSEFAAVVVLQYRYVHCSLSCWLFFCYIYLELRLTEWLVFSFSLFQF